MAADKVLNLMDQYYDYIGGNTNYPKSRVIIFKLLDDVTDRRGWRQEWDGFDDDIQIEILETWLDIVEGVLHD